MTPGFGLSNGLRLSARLGNDAAPPATAAAQGHVSAGWALADGQGLRRAPANNQPTYATRRELGATSMTESGNASAPGMPERLLSIAEVRECLRVGHTWLYGQIKLGRLKVVKLGRRTMVRASEVQRVIDEGSQP